MRSNKLLAIAALNAVVLMSAAGPALAADDLVDKVMDAGKLRVCQIDYPPLNIKDPISGKWEGLMVDMVEAFGADIGIEIEHVDTTWGTVVQTLKTDKCDMSAASTFVTAKRALEVLYTDTVTNDTQAAYVAMDSDLHSYADLNKPDKTVVVVSGSVNEANATQTLPNAEIKPLVTDRQQTTLLEVAAGRADAAFMSVISSLNFLRSNENVKVRPVDATHLFPTPVAWMVPKGQYHMREVINAWLASARANGTLGKMEEKWMGQQ